MAAYYNEIDRFAAAWLRELIARNLIAPGDVDERSIVDVRPDDLVGYTQCHFFAGIGGWSLALRGAGWADDRPVWTGSCPCQPFSPAGKGEGFKDPRHLWPDFFRLIRDCRPDVCFGEQTSSKAGRAWLDLVQADMEGIGYACGAADFPAAGVGAPHGRHRLYWVADAHGDRAARHTREEAGAGQPRRVEPDGSGELRPLADAERERGRGWPARRGNAGDAGLSGEARVLGDTRCHGNREHTRELPGDEGQHEDGAADSHHAPIPAGAAGGLADAAGGDAEHGGIQSGGEHGLRAAGGRRDGAEGDEERTSHFWSDVLWLPCSDGKARPVEPGTFPLAHGVPGRVGRLRGYGNAIVVPQAEAFIEAYLDVRGAA